MIGALGHSRQRLRLFGAVARKEWGRLSPILTGMKVLLDGSSYMVVGILPPGFFFPIRESDFIVQLVPDADPRRLDRGDHFLSGITRLKPGVSLGLAEQQLTATARRLQTMYPSTNLKNSGVRLVRLDEEVVGRFRNGLLLLCSAASVLLLMVCFSLANVSLTRASGRTHEFAIRSSSKASRGALIRHLLTEALLISSFGGCAAMAIAYGGMQLLLALSPPGLPRLAEVHIDGKVLALNLTLAIASGLFIGIAPAASVSRVELD